MRYPRLREARDHPPGRAVASAGAPHAGEARHPARRPSIAGTIAIRPAGLKPWKTSRRGPIASGTASPTRCASGSSQLALDEPELSPRELATRFTDTESYFVSEASVYRLLKAHDLITSPAFIVMKAADEFKDKTTAPNQLWQTDFTYLKVIGWGWFYLVDHPRRLLALHHRLEAVHDDEGRGRHRHAGAGAHGIRAAIRPGSSTNRACSATTAPVYVSGDLAKWLDDAGHGARSRRALSSADPGQDRALASDAQEPHPARKLLPARRSRSAASTPSSTTTITGATTRA